MRDEGFYWIIKGSDWVIGQWTQEDTTNGYWTTCGSEERIPTDELYEIGEQVFPN